LGDNFEGSSWMAYIETVRLDLEATEMIERIQTKPQIIYRIIRKRDYHSLVAFYRSEEFDFGHGTHFQQTSLFTCKGNKYLFQILTLYFQFLIYLSDVSKSRLDFISCF
jgi:hypothetical protein